MNTTTPTNDLTKSIPRPDDIRERLSVLVRETQALRQLLRVSERLHGGQIKKNDK